MEKDNSNNNILHIGFIGRLEKEKGALLLLELLKMIHQKKELEKMLIFHIVGGGAYKNEIISLGYPWINVYGNLSHEETLEQMKILDMIFVPSLFLETFGLVALEANIQGVPVFGVQKGGLREFIHSENTLRSGHECEDMLSHIEKMLRKKEKHLCDTQKYDKAAWRENLKNITKERKNILIIHDYISPIGGAEIYVQFLTEELTKTGHGVHLFGYKGLLSSFGRKFHFFLSQISIWRYFQVKDSIAQNKPDMIWMHSILRYIGPWGVLAIKKSGIPTLLSHHDLGLISPRPSQVCSESELEDSLGLANFFAGTYNPIEICERSVKYLSLKAIWKGLENIEAHIVPSEFMKKPYEKTSGKEVIVFPHTLI